MGNNLGLAVLVVLDATHTFDRTAPDGSVVTADELTISASIRSCGLSKEGARRNLQMGGAVCDLGGHDPMARRPTDLGHTGDTPTAKPAEFARGPWGVCGAVRCG